MTAFALPHPALGDVGNVRAATDGAYHHAIRPAALRKVRNAAVRIGKVQDCFLECLWLLHISIMKAIELKSMGREWLRYRPLVRPFGYVLGSGFLAGVVPVRRR